VNTGAGLFGIREPVNRPMNIKLLIFLTWIFYIAARRTADEIWQFCLIYSAVLSACAYFFQRENKSAKSKKKKK
jgi:hypothetical protein